MKNTTITTGAELMTLSPVQPGESGLFFPKSCAGASYCRNVRETSPGVLQAMDAPQELFATDAPVAFADTRDALTNVFTLDGRGRLVWHSSVDTRGEVIERGVSMGEIAPGRCSTASSGDFLVVRDSQGTLHYLLWKVLEESYIFLGRAPRTLTAEVSAVEGLSFGKGVEGVEFRNAVADFSDGVPDEVVRACELAVSKTFESISREARLIGCFTAPVLVRVAARMSDGSLLALSAPRVAAPVDFCQTRRVDLPLLATSQGYVGTAPTAITTGAFTLSVTADTSELGAWEELVSEIEIWVSETPNATDPSRSASMAFSPGSRPMLRFTPPLLSENEMAEKITTVLPAKMLTTPHRGRITAEVRRDASGEQRAVWLDDCAAPWERAGAICGHGGFLHLSGLRRDAVAPAMPQGEPGATATARCRVTVAIRTGTTMRYVVAEGSIKADDGRILPFYFYPAVRAVSVTISLDYGEGELYEDTFALTPIHSTESASIYSRPCRTAISLERTAELTATDATPAEPADSAAVSTMKRGNPLVRRCVTTAANGNIRAICAQQSRGGAYTRQYLYLFTSKGIIALTHNMLGMHANCRPISRRVVEGEQSVAVSDEGVFALTQTGELLRIADSTIQILLSGLCGYGLLAASDEHDELWVVPAESATADSLVLSLGAARSGDARATMADVRAQSVYESVCGLLTVNRHLLRYKASVLPAPSRGSEQLEGVWVSPPIECAGGVALAGVTIDGSADARLAVHLCNPEPTAEEMSLPPHQRGDLLIDGRVQGGIDGAVEMPLMLPLYPDADNRVIVSLAGHFAGLRGACLTR